MRLKQAVLQVMDRNLLKRISDELDIDDVDRRDRADMAAAVSRKHRATPKFLLDFLSESQVKQVCDLVGVSALGRRAELIHSLVEAGEESTGRGDPEEQQPQAETAPHSLREAPDPRDGMTGQSEEIEGLETPTSSGWGEYPLDSVFVRTETRTVGEIVRRIRADRYIMDPDFQRDFVWPVDKQSKLIESCAMRIPLPVFYVAEATDGRIIVVDGLQRLTTFARFLKGDLTLKGFGSDDDQNKPHPLTGKRFADLPITLRERIEDTQLTMYILDSKAPERARLDIFDRVNSGVPLSRQQMRNSLYNGPATRWLKSAADSKVFKDVTGETLDPKRMRDREAINRFCAFDILGWNTYTGGDMDGFLAKALEAMNTMPSKDLDALKASFDVSMKINYELFGRHAFRKSLKLNDQSANRSVINIALFDVCSVIFARLDSITSAQAKKIQQTMAALISDDSFNLAITYSTNSTRQVHHRFSAAEIAIKELATGC